MHSREELRRGPVEHLEVLPLSKDGSVLREVDVNTREDAEDMVRQGAGIARERFDVLALRLFRRYVHSSNPRRSVQL